MKYIIEEIALMAEWDYEKNTAEGLNPEKIGRSSHKKANWKCKQGHEWKAVIANRARLNRGCPYCVHQEILPGETDLATCYPNLAKEWDTEKNEISASDVMPGSHKKVWWICEKGHSFYSEIKSRTMGSGCPVCSGKTILKGFNDFETTEPELAETWHPTLNGDLKPSAVSFGSGKKVWWQCQYGHEFQSSPDNRRKHRECPKCLKSQRSSFPEQAIYYYVKKMFPDAINGYKDVFEGSMELDIYIPSIHTGIEYDGCVYHSSNKNRLRDAKKYQLCKDNGIMLIRVREWMINTPLMIADHIIEIPDASNLSLNSAISTILFHLNHLTDVNVERDRKEIRALLGERRNSFKENYPQIAAEWDYEANGKLKPELFSTHSNDKVGWKCSKCGNKWATSIGDRTRPDATGCPKCALSIGAEKRVANMVKYKGSLAELYPNLLEEWNYEKNKDIDPTQVTVASGKKVWWTCKVCHKDWEASIAHRTNERGCPICLNKIIIPGYNDFATAYPMLLIDWDYEENKEVDPSRMAPHSGKKVAWKCHICGNKWKTAIAHRSAGKGCPNYRYHKKCNQLNNDCNLENDK